VESGVGELLQGKSLWDLVAEWFVNALEKLLKRGLLRDYASQEEFLKAVRGRIEPVRTAAALYTGRFGAECTFDEFDFDMPLNRILRAGAAVVARSPACRDALRRRALRSMARFGDVGQLESGDFTQTIEKRTLGYADALCLAKHIIVGVGREMEHGRDRAWTFLFRTPEIVEEGLRRLIVAGLQGSSTVSKQGMRIRGSPMTFTPDLKFGDVAVADIKYKVTSDWIRSDLYQAVTFATAFGTTQSAIVGFSAKLLDSVEVRVGGVHVRRFAWKTENMEPSQSEGDILREIRNWLHTMTLVATRHI
jgi:5-methylcytosine-specific restriction endonuclease McrBC regulatory subunit McrC